MSLTDANLGLSLPRADVVLIYQHMLPYHKARFEAISVALVNEGKSCLALEVSSTDASYGQLDNESTDHPAVRRSSSQVICLFPEKDYLLLRPMQVANTVERALQSIRPDVVFSPAPAFAEGAGALHYKVRNGGKLILMDDAWVVTDRRGWLTRVVKRLLYLYVDGGFFPAPLHGDYFVRLNIPHERQCYAVDVVGNVSAAQLEFVKRPLLLEPYFLFVGRLISRKGLDVILRALSSMESSTLKLVVVGDGPERQNLQSLAKELGLDGRVQWMGRQHNSEARLWMRNALAVVIPSEFEQWGLVVNEAWAAGALVLGSNSVGALRATTSTEKQWMLLPVGDVLAWREALSRLFMLPAEERAHLVQEGYKLAEQYSLEKHVESAINLMNLPARPNPLFVIGWLAGIWYGKVAVW